MIYSSLFTNYNDVQVTFHLLWSKLSLNISVLSSSSV